MAQRGQDPFSPKFQYTAFTEMDSSNACFPSSRPLDETARQSKRNPVGSKRSNFTPIPLCLFPLKRVIRAHNIVLVHTNLEQKNGNQSDHRLSDEHLDGSRVATGSLTVPDSNADETRIHWFASVKEKRGAQSELTSTTLLRRDARPTRI